MRTVVLVAILGSLISPVFGKQKHPPFYLTPRYVVKELPFPAGATHQAVIAINNAGQVLGEATVPVPSGFESHSFIFQGGTTVDLGRFFAVAFNDRGQVVGRSVDSDVVIYENGQIHTLPGLPNGADPYAINNHGQIVGSVYDGSGGDSRPFLYEKGKMSYLGGNVTGTATAINDAGTIVGTVKPNTKPRAVVFHGSSYYDLGALPVPKNVPYFPPNPKRHLVPVSQALGINSRGQIVGSTDYYGDIDHVFGSKGALFFGGRVTNLGALEDQTVATAINRQQQIVGYDYLEEEGGPASGVLFDQGKPFFLAQFATNPTGYSIGAAVGINDRGEIAAVGVDQDEYGHGLLLEPIATLEVAESTALATTRSTVRISGHASGSVDRVQYRGNTGGYRKAFGVRHWHFNAPLKLGKNTITIRTRSASGEATPVSVVVTRR